jgi:hypothetical protein
MEKTLARPKGRTTPDLTNRRFGKLVALKFEGPVKGHMRWRCQCDCGRECSKRSEHLLAGVIVSCSFCPKAKSTTRRGVSSHELRGLWRNMIDRCMNPDAHNYRWYGATGVGVCERWLTSFDAFVQDVGPRPPGCTLDRFPNKHGNYEPGNVRWATKDQQANNARNNIICTLGDRTMTLKQWSRELGVKYLRLYGLVVIRLMPFDEAVNQLTAPLTVTSRTAQS